MTRNNLDVIHRWLHGRYLVPFFSFIGWGFISLYYTHMSYRRKVNCLTITLA